VNGAPKLLAEHILTGGTYEVVTAPTAAVALFQVEGTASVPSATITAEPPTRTAVILSPSRSHSTCMRLGRPISMP
jgi:hypothetical protein